MPITTSTIDQSPAIQHGHAFAALSTGHGAILNDFDAARLRTATQGIHTITALLQQRELDVEGSDAGAYAMGQGGSRSGSCPAERNQPQTFGPSQPLFRFSLRISSATRGHFSFCWYFCWYFQHATNWNQALMRVSRHFSIPCGGPVLGGTPTCLFQNPPGLLPERVFVCSMLCFA